MKKTPSRSPSPAPATATATAPSTALTCSRATPRKATSRAAFRGLPPAPDDPLLGFAPVPHKAPRSNSITAPLQRAFIAELAATGIVTQAARHIGKSLEALYKLRHRPGAEEFAAAWDTAVDLGVARLEHCALARALEGEEVPLVSRGEIIGMRRKYNEALVMFLLRQRRSQRFSAGRYAGNLRPGDPAYERVRREVLAEVERTYPSEAEVLASINAKIALMRERDAEIAANLAS